MCLAMVNTGIARSFPYSILHRAQSQVSVNTLPMGLSQAAKHVAPSARAQTQECSDAEIGFFVYVNLDGECH